MVDEIFFIVGDATESSVGMGRWGKGTTVLYVGNLVSLKRSLNTEVILFLF